MSLSRHKGKALMGLLLMLVALTVTVLPANAEKENVTSGKVYYVSSSTGDDGNDGTSEDTAWKSLAKISEVTLAAGDAVLLKKGDTWIGEQLVLNNPTGTKEAPAMLGAYGEGEKPKVWMYETEVPKYSADPLIKPVNAENFVIDGLDIGFCGVGIDLYYHMTTNKENVRIQNCHFHDIYGFHQNDFGTITKYPHATGIVVTSNVPIPGCADPVIKGLYIDNCTTYDAGALYTYGSRIGSDGRNVKGLYVTNCTMENNGIYGIAPCGMDDGYMDNCKIIDCGSRYSPMGSMGVMISGSNFTIMNSEICFQQRLEDNPDGGGIDFEHFGYDIDVINCYIHDNSGVGVMMYSSGQDASHQNKRVRFIGNVFENNNQNVFKPGGAEIISLPLYSLVDGSIYNNRYMESENLFAMSMDASVTIAGNVSYPRGKQGQMWPVYNFDDVRAYVIDGTPLPSLDEKPADEEVQYTWMNQYGNYFIGLGVGLVVVLLMLIIALIFIGSKKKNRKVPAAMLLIALILTGVLNVDITAYAANKGLNNPTGTEKDGVYRLTQMCTDKMGLWQYYWTDGTEATKMVYDEEGKIWKGASPATTAMVGGNTSWHTYTSGYSLATFTCPASGSVRIGTETAIELTNAEVSADGTIFIVMSDGKLIGTPVQVEKANPKQEYETVEMDVYEGQVIGFYLHMNVNNAGDSTRVQPFVEYTTYKDVKPAQQDIKQDADPKTEGEKVLRTDIAPMKSREKVSFAVNPVQIMIGAVPVVIIGICILIILLSSKKRSKER